MIFISLTAAIVPVTFYLAKEEKPLPEEEDKSLSEEQKKIFRVLRASGAQIGKAEKEDARREHANREYPYTNPPYWSIQLNSSKVTDDKIPLLSEVKKLKQSGLRVYLYVSPDYVVTQTGVRKQADCDVVDDLDISAAWIDDRYFEGFERLKLRRLTIGGGSSITDVTLKIISRIETIEVLNIPANSKITDEGVKEVANLERLKKLNLIRTPITGSCLNALGKMKRLATLELQNSGVNDAGLAHLAQAPALEILNLEGTNITDAGLKHIGTMPNLKELNITGTKVTDVGMKHLTTMPKLQVLYLTDLPITDQGLRELENAKNLKVLCFLHPTKTTPVGFQRLKQMRPDLKVYLAQED